MTVTDLSHSASSSVYSVMGMMQHVVEVCLQQLRLDVLMKSLVYVCQVPDDKKMCSQPAVAVSSGGMGVYSFAVPISPPLQPQQHTMSVSPHQQPASAFVASQPVLASAGLVLVPADSLSTQPASAPVLWQVSGNASSQPALPIATDNPAFFRVATSAVAGCGSLPIVDSCMPCGGSGQAASFAPICADYIVQSIVSCQMMTQPIDTITIADQTTSLRNASSIPDIVLTGTFYMYSSLVIDVKQYSLQSMHCIFESLQERNREWLVGTAPCLLLSLYGII